MAVIEQFFEFCPAILKNRPLCSGATRHMCNNAQNFKNLMSNEKLRVYTAAESFIESKSIGIVALNIQLENDISSRVELKDTLYVPDLRNNFLSV